MTPTARRLLEAAVGRAATAATYEITVEHLLAALLGSPGDGGDSAHILGHFSQDRERLSARVERTIERLRAGKAGRPVFSDELFECFESAWLWASVEQGATRLRSGALLVALVCRLSRYTAESYPELEAIPVAELKRDFHAIVARSPESAEATPHEATAGGSGRTESTASGGEALKAYSHSFTEKARRGQLDRIFGREREIRQIIDILARRRKNNPILVGEPGVGKTALVEGLAQAIVDGVVPEELKHVDLLGLDLALLQAGASVRGEFESRLKRVIAEVQASPRPIILFIDEAHTLIGAGGGAGTGDAANLLKPALARGELRTVAATTYREFKKYFEKDPALERRFQPVKIDEPSVEDAIVMLRGVRTLYEAAHRVPIRDEAVVAAVKLSERFISGRQLPDKAVDLLDTAAARVRVETDAKPEELTVLEAALAALEREEVALRRDAGDGVSVDPKRLGELEARIASARVEVAALSARWNAERDAVVAVRKARAALTALDEKAPNELVAKLNDEVALALAKHAEIAGERQLVRLDVDAEAVARVVASWTGIPAGKMNEDALAAALALEQRLQARIRGQDAAIRTVAETIRMAHAGIRDPQTPVGTLLFVGTSGVGKTETALALAEALYGGERSLITINMSEFQERHTVSRLIGSPPGYVGFGEGGLLTEAVRQRPHSVVLLDECEKADLEVMNLFYQVFDKGTLQDGEGRPTDFRHAIVILASNLGSEIIAQLHERHEPPAVDEVVAAIRPSLSKHFKPALLARMTIVPFAPISRSIMRQIAHLKLGALATRLRTSHGIETTYAPELIDEVTRRCSEAETGARTVDHILRGSLMPRIARDVLQRIVTRSLSQRLNIGLRPDGDWRVEFVDE